MNLAQELKAVPDSIKKRVHRDGGIKDTELVALVSKSDIDTVIHSPNHPKASDVSSWDSVLPGDELRGEQAINDGEVAFVLLVGGVGTRAGGHKAFFRLPNVGLSLLAWKLLQAGQMPVWVMTTPDMTKEVQRHISGLALPMGMNGCIFEQFEGYRLTPDNHVQLGNLGLPELYPLGHGDIGPALMKNGVLDDNPNVKYAYVCNVDNVLASPHPGIIGRHIRVGASLTCEVVERQKNDRGGVVAGINGKLQIVEDFRLPHGFMNEAKHHNTNTMLINVDILRWSIPWRWHRVMKQVDGRTVIQYERLLQQYTEEHNTDFIAVPRLARYCPVKNNDDLNRAGELLKGYHFR